MKNKNKILFMSGIVASIFSPTIHASDSLFSNELLEVKANQAYGKGLRDLTKDEDEKLSKRKIKKIKANSLALKRSGIRNDDLVKSQVSDEFILASDTTSSEKENFTQTFLAEVDNSKLNAFPPIGNQAGQNSCAAFAATYYLMSHEYCLVSGCDNKNYQEKIFSPRWTYNLINSGVDNGAYFSDAFQVMNHHGAITNVDFPYGTDFRSWSVDSEHWREAIGNKMSALFTMGIGTDAEMDLVKQTLLNGHVVVVGTYINSWIYKTVGSVANTLNPYAGESIAIAMNGTLGGHAMTIVGYNDEIWTDINANGLVEESEKGAFKIANSWGTNWKNKGFVWASYEAFRITPTVSNFSLLNRLPLAKNSGNKVLTSTYSFQQPKAYAKFNISHLKRNQININFGTSTLTSTLPTVSFNPYAFNGRGGAYAFDGTTLENDSYFYLDATSLLSSDLLQTKFYLKVTDSLSGDPLSLNSFQIVDPQSDDLIYNATISTPIVDGTNTTVVAKFEDNERPSEPTSLAAQLKTVKSGKKITYFARLTWTASTDNVSVSKYIIFRNGVKLAESLTNSFEDGKTSTGVIYNYTVQAVDSSGNVSNSSAAVQFKR